MLLFAIFLFFLAAVFGLVILTAILQDRPTNKYARLLHGAIAITAVTLLVLDIVLHGASTLLLISLILFLGAAAGGVTMFLLDYQKKPVPKFIAVVHPIVALAALITLIIDVLP